jgi:hypothetical protein
MRGNSNHSEQRGSFRAVIAAQEVVQLPDHLALSLLPLRLVPHWPCGIPLPPADLPYGGLASPGTDGVASWDHDASPSGEDRIPPAWDCPVLLAEPLRDGTWAGDEGS